MRYKIEYLEESTEEGSVCHTIHSEAVTLDSAEREARLRGSPNSLCADGYQIRDLMADGRIVALECFNL